MRPIPIKLREEMASDIYYKKCCLKDIIHRGKIEFHHNLILGGKQSNIKEAILPVCEYHHDQARNTEIKEKLDLIMLNRMSDEQIQSISKAVDYKQRKKYLNAKYDTER